jgi:hypothetical protein
MDCTVGNQQCSPSTSTAKDACWKDHTCTTANPGGTMIDSTVAQLLGELVVAEVAKLPALHALAIFFETGQGAPVFYFAHETVEHAMARLSQFADQQITEMEAHRDRLIADGPQRDIDTMTSDLSALPYLHQSIIGNYCNGLLDTGYWVNPASPVLDSVHATIDSWATAAFAALSSDNPEVDWMDAYHDITGTFWAAIDVARRASVTWPPIAFVRSFDDNGGDLTRVIGTRHDTLS